MQWRAVLVEALALAFALGCNVNPYLLGGGDDASPLDAPVGDGSRDGGCVAQPELCDTLDNDCDDLVDETFQLDRDPANCGSCGNACTEPSGTTVGTCESSVCVFTCLPGRVDLDPGVPGCEYACTATAAADGCDGSDDDCDGELDEDVVLPGAGFCQGAGACAGAAPVCAFDACTAQTRVHCAYGPGVELDPVTCAVAAEETRCDDIDNDCDGGIDDPFATKGDECDDGDLGVCRRVGVYVCNAAGTDVTCDFSASPPDVAASAEMCNGRDDDCDGSLDESAPDTMVDVTDAGGMVVFRIDAYEASRPDATATAGGVTSHRACSNPVVVPWANVNHDQAAVACAAAGKRLCTGSEWQLACASAAGRAYPYGTTYQPNACNGNDYDDDCAPPDADLAFATGTPYGCPKPAQSECVSAAGAFDLSGNLKEWTSAEVQPDVFRVRGGAFDSPPGGLRCDFAFVAMDRTFQFPNLGFRCCGDAP